MHSRGRFNTRMSLEQNAKVTKPNSKKAFLGTFQGEDRENFNEGHGQPVHRLDIY